MGVRSLLPPPPLENYEWVFFSPCCSPFLLYIFGEMHINKVLIGNVFPCGGPLSSMPPPPENKTMIVNP